MRAVVGSVGVHAVLGWLLLHGDREGRPDAPARTPVTITVTDPVEVSFVSRADTGGSSGPAGSTSSGGSSATQASLARATPARPRRLEPDPRGTITIDDGRDLERAAPTTGDGTATGAAVGAGAGAGTGRGTGTGIGFGDGGSIQRPQLLTPPPAPRGDPPSRARPARLIYPTRHRDVEDAELFIARVIIDDDGFVAGAKLVRGFGGRGDEVASQMIWQFRYAPALDDGGRPIQSTLEQRFLVGP